MASDKKSVAEIEKSLQPGESVIDSVAATFLVTQDKAFAGALALTASRLIFSGTLLVSKNQHSSPLSLVTSVTLSQDLLFAFIEVTLAASVSKYRVRHPKEAEAFVHAVNEVLVAAQAVVAPTVAVSAAEELTKLADLHSKGLLTDDEFVAAKAKALA